MDLIATLGPTHNQHQCSLSRSHQHDTTTSLAGRLSVKLRAVGGAPRLEPQHSTISLPRDATVLTLRAHLQARLPELEGVPLFLYCGSGSGGFVPTHTQRLLDLFDLFPESPTELRVCYATREVWG